MFNFYEGYGRPNYLSDYIEQYHKSSEFWKGKWVLGNNICCIESKGAICQMFDINNERQDGRFFMIISVIYNKKNQIYKAVALLIILPFLFTLFLALLSIRHSLKVQGDRINYLFHQGYLAKYIQSKLRS